MKPFVVLIPARLGSTRLPNKPLADIGGVPMIVRVARRAAESGAEVVAVAADHEEIVAACHAHRVNAILTSATHETGSDRLAEACTMLDLTPDTIVVNVQGDEPLLPPELVLACADTLAARPECVMATAAHPIDDPAEIDNPNVVKLVCDAGGRALYFSRAPIPWWRDGRARGEVVPETLPLRHIGIYAYRSGFLVRFPQLRRSPIEAVESLEQLRVLWHGEKIAVHVTRERPGPGVDTPEDLERVRALVAAQDAAAGNP